MTDPLLKEDTSRYVMFPIQDEDIWKMYKKQVDCFWRWMNFAGWVAVRQ